MFYFPSGHLIDGHLIDAHFLKAQTHEIHVHPTHLRPIKPLFSHQNHKVGQRPPNSPLTPYNTRIPASKTKGGQSVCAFRRFLATFPFHPRKRGFLPFELGHLYPISPPSIGQTATFARPLLPFHYVFAFLFLWCIVNRLYGAHATFLAPELDDYEEGPPDASREASL